MVTCRAGATAGQEQPLEDLGDARREAMRVLEDEPRGPRRCSAAGRRLSVSTATMFSLRAERGSWKSRRSWEQPLEDLGGARREAMRVLSVCPTVSCLCRASRVRRSATALSSFRKIAAALAAIWSKRHDRVRVRPAYAYRPSCARQRVNGRLVPGAPSRRLSPHSPGFFTRPISRVGRER